MARGAVRLFTFDGASEGDEEVGELDDVDDDADDIEDESEHDEMREHAWLTLLAMPSGLVSLALSTEGSEETGNG